MSERFLGELAELEGGELHKELVARRQVIVDTWTASDDERRDLIAKGQKRVLDQLIDEIETAKDKIKRSRQGAERSHMSKAF